MRMPRSESSTEANGDGKTSGAAEVKAKDEIVATEVSGDAQDETDAGDGGDAKGVQEQVAKILRDPQALEEAQKHLIESGLLIEHGDARYAGIMHQQIQRMHSARADAG